MNGMLKTASRLATMFTAAGLMMSSLTACGGSEQEGPAAPVAEAKNTYVMIHGAFADNSAWDKLVPLLEKDGNEVILPELPAHGKDTKTVADATMQAYTDAVVSAIDSASRPVILVGHSLGGAVASQAAEARPNKVKKLVYLAALLLGDGKSTSEALKGDKDAKLGEYLIPSDDGSVFTVKDGWVENAFCQDCSAADAAAIREHFRPEPIAPFNTPIHVTEGNWGKVPRVYIEATRDLAISPAWQRSFYTALPVEKVIPIDAGHCPFLTKPAELADALKSL